MEPSSTATTTIAVPSLGTQCCSERRGHASLPATSMCVSMSQFHRAPRQGSENKGNRDAHACDSLHTADGRQNTARRPRTGEKIGACPREQPGAATAGSKCAWQSPAVERRWRSSHGPASEKEVSITPSRHGCVKWGQLGAAVNHNGLSFALPNWRACDGVTAEGASSLDHHIEKSLFPC